MSIFDGLAGVINAALGDAVTIDPNGAARVVRGIIRDETFVVDQAEAGSVEVVKTTLRLRSADAAFIADGVEVSQGGRSWVVEYHKPSDSPAADRLETFYLGDF